MSSEWINVSRTKKNGKGIASSSSSSVYPKRGSPLSRQHCGQISHSHDDYIKTNFNDNDVKQNVDDVLDRLQKTIDELLLSSYLEFVFETIHEIVSRNGVTFNSILGLGLGTLSSPTSLLQLAMYLCLCRKLLLDVTDNGDLHNRRVVYDPNMTSYDRSVCERLGITVLSTNLKGKHRIINNYKAINNHNGFNALPHIVISDDPSSIVDRQSDGGYSCTLCFLPHCPYRLYCNLLWENWQDLDKLFILGNSFESYGSRRLVTTKATSSHMKGSHASSSMINPRDITDSVSIVTTHIEETSLWPSQLARSTFMKESKDSKYYHYLENAMCDLSFMCLSEECKHSPDRMAALQAMKPSDEEIDQAAMADDELF